MKFFILSMSLFGLALADIYDNCASDNCFVVPESGSDAASCIASKNCAMVATFSRVDAGVKFEVQAERANVDDGKHYVALGLSTDTSMGGDAVVGCYGQQVENYWNTKIPHNSFTLGNSEGLSEVSTSSANGKLGCSFVHDVKVTYDLPFPLSDATIDLDANKYHLLLATGPLNGEGLIARHELKMASEDAFKF